MQNIQQQQQIDKCNIILFKIKMNLNVNIN